MKKLAVFLAVFLMPSLALAQGAQDLNGIIDTSSTAVGKLTTLLVAIAMLMFIWGIVKYVIAGDEEAKAKGRQMMIWGVVGLFAIVAVWGLVKFIANTTGIGPNTGASSLPCPPGVAPGTVINGSVCI